jgi:hypothetical protein
LKKIKKLIKKLNNRGSSLIMVIVSIAFVAIIVGALLSAAAYAYRLKLINKNAKDNFYYVEQAMQEIYAGVGEKTVDQMYEAYTTTIENMVYYDLSKNGYSTLTNEQANEMFKDQFMGNIQGDDYFKQSDTLLAESLGNFISNSTVTIDKIILQDITLTRTSEYTNNSGSGTYTQTVSADIEISQPDFDVNFNSTTTDYSTIFDYALIADMGIEINKNSDSVLKITGNLYAAADYYNKSYDAEVSDDDEFVNSSESSATSSSRDYSYKVSDDRTITYTHGSVSSKKYAAGDDTGLKSKTSTDIKGDANVFDGEDTNSMYSGLYITNSNVSILADTVIVPGTIAVMNNSDLSVYTSSSGNLSASEVWADNIVLGGYGEKQSSEESKTSYKAPNAYFYANLYVRDDTELNAESSDFELKGMYFGYGDSTDKDTRVFVPTVNSENFQIKVEKTDANGNVVKDANGNVQYEYVNRDHYNSSSIVINGQNSTLDLKNATVLYLAGRAYIELSKNVTYNAEDGVDAKDNEKDGSVYVTKDGVLTDTATGNTEVVTETYSYNPGTKDKDGKVTTYLSDYKTGESLAVKSTQVAYIPIILNGIPADHTLSGKTYTCVQLHPSISGVAFFGDFFPTSVFKDGYVPVISQAIGKRTYYYYDLETAYDILKAANADITKTYTSADQYSAAFVKAYTDEANAEAAAEAAGEESTYDLPLNDILANKDFTSGNIILSGSKNDGSGTAIYSSGAITTKEDTVFNMIVKNADNVFPTDTDLWNSLLATTTGTTTASANELKALAYSDTLSTEYTYMKWNLGHFDSSEQSEQDYVDSLLASGWTEDMLTPINRYMVFSNISSKATDNITPSGFELSSGYKVWISSDDVVVGANEDTDFTSLEKTNGKVTEGVIKGIVITKGDVTFSDSVTKFEGLIIAGGKIYIDGNLQSITASPEICRSIIKECILVNDEKSQYVRNVFAQYKISDDGTCPICGTTLVTTTDADGNILKDDSGNPILSCPKNGCTYNAGATDDELVTIDNLDYTDVCSIDNWVKNVE